MITKQTTRFIEIVIAIMVLWPFSVKAQENQVVTEQGNHMHQTAVAQVIEMPLDYPSDLLAIQQEQIAAAYVVVDQASRQILLEKASQEPLPIASMSKIVSVYLIYQAIEQGRLSLDTQVPVSDEIANALSYNPDLSSANLQAGLTYSVQDLLHAIMIQSGNDATSALMTYLYGSEQAAVAACRELLQAWGITQFEFYTVSGLPLYLLPVTMQVSDAPSGESENRMTAADVALVAQYLIEDYPQVLDITSKISYTFAAGTDHEQVFTSTNSLLPGNLYGRSGITGLKSGTGLLAGQNFVATSTENGRAVISVVMGVPTGYDRYLQVHSLLDAVNRYPNLYQLALPSNYRKTRAELEAEAISLSLSQSESEAVLVSSIVAEADQVASQKRLKLILIGSGMLLVIMFVMTLFTKRLIKVSKRKLEPNIYLQKRRR